MIDLPSQWIIQQIQHCTQGTDLWCCDENALHQIADAQLWPHKPLFISNRYDIAQQAKKLGFESHFSDFDLSSIADHSVDHFFYRISKEKAIVHHLLNEALRVLKPQGILFLSGQKNEGIKTYIEKASLLLGSEKKIQKDGPNYSSQLSKNKNSLTSANSFLEDNNYGELRACLSFNEHVIYSKPGQFGWDKIDQGSEFLISEINKIVTDRSINIERCLDLGCGYGFLTIASQHLPIKQRVLTDNNAAALISAQRNCAYLELNAEIIASDAGATIKDKFDLILCNPPFHQGFNIDGDLTDKFLLSTKQLLAAKGVAYFVVNQFIPLEKKAQPHFKLVSVIAQNKSFKVVELCNHSHKNLP
ncbi:MAG: methyltransferase [Pseudomonadota bacterium]